MCIVSLAAVGGEKAVSARPAVVQCLRVTPLLVADAVTAGAVIANDHATGGPYALQAIEGTDRQSGAPIGAGLEHCSMCVLVLPMRWNT